MSQDWLWMSAGDLGRGIGTGEIDPVALTQVYLDAMQAHELRDRIYARTTDARALAEAEAASKRAQLGQRRGLLDGVPISWKDLFDTAGIATEAGTALLKDRVPTHDAPVVGNATAAGTICLGKTHMSELAFSGLGYNPITATPPCVNDADAVPGGSSSGAAASVAFGLAPCGIGSDTGGSVRVPAAWNDLVGLKTTAGRLTLKGVVPLVASFDTIGPLCRSVEDAGLMLAAMEGSKAPDLRGASLQGARLMVLDTIATEGLRDAPAAAFEASVAKLAAAGASIEHRKIPLVAEIAEIGPILFTTEAYATWRKEIEAAPEKMFPEILKRFRIGADKNGADYVATWQRVNQLRAQWLEETAGYDAVIIPTCPNLPPNLERLLSDSDYFVKENLLTLRNTRIGNLLGLCGLTLPTGVSSCGIMLMGAPMAEARLLRLGAAAEAALA